MKPWSLAALRTAAAEALRRRGVADPAADLAAETGVTVSHTGFQRWIASPGSDLRDCMHTALAELRGLLSTS